MDERHHPPGIEPDEAREAHTRKSPSEQVVYAAILEEGEKELARPSGALFWSGLAAGLSMGFSFITQGVLHALLPAAPWRPLVAAFGYSVGFLIVILGRQQLFTENTLTPILPLLRHKTARRLGHVLRLWGIVLAANLLGALLVGLVLGRTTAFDPEIREAFGEIAREAMAPSFGTLLLRGIFAGWLIALLVWVLPYAESAHVLVIVLLTYVISIGHFSHVVAGAVEVFTLAAEGGTTWGAALGHFVLPTLIGNVLGGVTLVAALNHAQVVSGHE